MTQDKMECWRETNNELAALHQDEVTFGSWRYLWERFGPSLDNPRRAFQPRMVAAWYVRDLHAV